MDKILSEVHFADRKKVLTQKQILTTRILDFHNSDIGFLNSDVGFSTTQMAFISFRTSENECEETRLRGGRLYDVGLGLMGASLSPLVAFVSI